ncbi:Fic family protein [Moraxella nasovis]|uniref:Fic family protein n=1 Tax=Moraxella nasovis TaxID=2904121 RepID=UPI001F60D97F|nr:Fic family protein [Moraxella nasovis]UNU73064.1 Fic family protein [Moraxella nasovis]
MSATKVELSDKFNLTLDQNRFLARKNIVEVIHSISRLEKVNTTFPQTKTIIDGMSVGGISTHDIQVVLNLKNAWQFILKSDTPFDLDFACRVNAFVAYNESLAWGVLRTGNVGISGVGYVPSIPIKSDIENTLNKIHNLPLSKTVLIIKTMYYMMRQQIFWDGNKRTAIICANYQLILSGLGILNINENQLEIWNNLLSEFYETNDDDKIIAWTYEHCLYGIE